MTQIILTVIFVQLLENRVYFEIFFCLREKKTRVTLIQNFIATSQKKIQFKGLQCTNEWLDTKPYMKELISPCL